MYGKIKRRTGHYIERSSRAVCPVLLLGIPGTLCRALLEETTLMMTASQKPFQQLKETTNPRRIAYGKKQDTYFRPIDYVINSDFPLITVFFQQGGSITLIVKKSWNKPPLSLFCLCLAVLLETHYKHHIKNTAQLYRDSILFCP